MTTKKTEKLTLTLINGREIDVWLETSDSCIHLRSCPYKAPLNTRTDVILYPSGNAYYLPSGSFPAWRQG